MLQSRLVPASEFGAHLTPYPPCRGYSFDERSDVERHRIPSVNPSHFFSHDVFGQLSLWWRFAEAEPLYISGPTGAGKSSTACQFCARLGMPVVSVMARPRMDRRELIGRWVMDEKGMRWVDGPAALCWRYGWILLINEFSCAGPELWVSCNDILEGLPLELDQVGRVLPRHPEARVIITDNTRGASGEAADEGFLGRRLQDRSTIDRFWHLRMEGLNEYEETALLVATLRRDWKEALPPEVLSDLCVRLARVGADSRAAAKKTSMAFENASVAVSHRVLRRVRDILCSLLLGEAGKMNDPIRSAVRLAFSEALGAVEREAVETLFVTTLGNFIDEARKRVNRRDVEPPAFA